jgi:hypothetical protein
MFPVNTYHFQTFVQGLKTPSRTSWDDEEDMTPSRRNWDVPSPARSDRPGSDRGERR